MARLVYALCGYGRGHTSRALAVTQTLRERGHEVSFACGGPGADRLRALGEAVLQVPALRQVLRRNRVRLWASARANLPLTWQSPEIIAQAADALASHGVDLVIGDHEPFVPRAARRAGVPVVSLNHQQILTETRCRVRPAHLLSAWGTAAGIAFIAPSQPASVIVPTFFSPRLRRRSDAVLVPPILRDDVLASVATTGEHVLVYVNEGAGMEVLLRRFGQLDASVVVYGLEATDAPANVTLRSPDRASFLRDLAAARAVIATAGFTLLSEALHLGKPVLALPNRGFFEQRVNAQYLASLGLGEQGASVPSARAVAGFLDRAARYARPQASRARGLAGRERAADQIERVLAGPAHASGAARPVAAGGGRFIQSAPLGNGDPLSSEIPSPAR